LETANKNLITAEGELKKYQTEKDKPTYDSLEEMYNRYKNESEILSQRLKYAESEQLKHEEHLQYEKQKN
jgi:hypothetical protein